VYHKNAVEQFFKAPLFSSVKNLLGKEIRTMPANLCIIWLMTLSLYVLLFYDVLRKILGIKFNRNS
jgi:hypothetical protein